MHEMSSFVRLHNVLAEIIAILFINSLRSRSVRVVTRARVCVCVQEVLRNIMRNA